MNGAAIGIENASITDTILSVKQRVRATNPKMPVRRQRLVYCPGPHGMDALADNETLGGAGVAQDGSAKLDVLLADLTDAEVDELGDQVVPLSQNVLRVAAIIALIFETFISHKIIVFSRPTFISATISFCT